MKSFCIKTNNPKILDYLLKNLETSPLPNIYFISKQFKNYKNVIVHYLGDNLNIFLEFISDILSNTIYTFYTPILLQKFINLQYFYFDNFEKKIIESNCYEYITLEKDLKKESLNIIWAQVLKYILLNKSMILDGFVFFRLSAYTNKLEDVVDYGVNQYVVEKEYNEFIDLLRLYVNSKQSKTSTVHLIYNNNSSILLDENKNVIDINNDVFDVKYLSDISFSSNDYALNALLSLLPKKIEIHLLSSFEDDFINTLRLIFENRILICTNCEICSTYKFLTNVKNEWN